MARHERHRSRSRSPHRHRDEPRAEKKRKRDEDKVNGVRRPEEDRGGHDSKRRKSGSPDGRGLNGRAETVNGHGEKDSTGGSRHKRNRDQPSSSRRRSRSPARDDGHRKESIRERSPLSRGPRSSRDDNDRRRRKHQPEAERVKDSRTAAAVPKHRPKKHDKPVEDEDEIEYVIDEGIDTFRDRVMGFIQFKSTKNTKVPGNSKLYGVRKEKKTEYRQYMNRIGGFNRPLSPSREA